VNYGGSLLLTNLGGTLASGDSFQLFTGSTYAGIFTNVAPAIPAVNLAWNTNSLATGWVSIVFTPTPPPSLSRIAVSKTNVVISGTNGVPNWTYYVVTSTNLGLPLVQWQRLATNSFDSHGNFSFADQMVSNAAQRFYRVVLQ
jgi:hypothetical protein